jgi:hypothetical protein
VGAADNAAGTTVGIPVLGGTLTINADGSMVVDTPATSGVFFVDYQLDNSIGSDIGRVTIEVTDPP